MQQKAPSSAEDIRRQRDKKEALRKLYFRHAATLIRHFDEWKDNPEFYFIELKLDMAYYCAGFAARLADPPYHLGTIVRNSLKNPGLFTCDCPDGHRAWAYTYNGSPLSGRFDLGMACPQCGWNGWVTRSGWRVRSEALKATQAEDMKRLGIIKLTRPDFHGADIRDLLRALGIPEKELELPPVEHKVERTEMPDGTVILHDLDGGSVIISPGYTVTFNDWNGPERMVGREIAQMKALQKDRTDGED